MLFQHWFHEGVTGSARSLRRAVWLAGLVFGLVAEWLARSGQGLGAAGADLVVGWALIGCGLHGWSRRPQSSTGPLLALTGFAWYAGTLASSRIGAVAAVGAALLFLHRGPLCHAIIGYPGGRRLGRLGVVVVGACYVYAAAAPLAGGDVMTIGVALLVLAATAWQYARAVGPDRRARLTAVAAAAVVAIPLAGGSAWRLAGAGSDADPTAVLLVYEAALILIAAGFPAGFRWGRSAQEAVTRLVVDLGDDSDAGTLRARLAHALGDRSLVIGYWLPEANGYVDERGMPFTVPEAGSGRAVTVVEHDGERIAALIHDATVLDTPGLADSVAQATKIVLSTVRLRADVQRQVAELAASRRRMLEAGDAQRRRLQKRLQVSAGQRLAHVQELLDVAVLEARMCPDEAAAERLEAASRDLAGAQADLRELAAGIHPAVLTEQGLGPALASLAERASLPVQLTTPSERLPAVIETAAYFVCSEALANVAKHARATRADIQVRSEGGTVTILIADDGAGGADPSSGTGLNGAADRIAALGGRLLVQSPAGEGTRLLAEIPASSSRCGARDPNG
jgi:signal transduction histidine kinase